MAVRNRQLPEAVKLALYFLGLVGLLGTWGRSLLDGTLVHLFDALYGADDYILPGTHHPLKRSFTGLYWPIDYLLDVLVVFFWEGVDGSHPSASATGIYFLGQFFPLLVCFYVDHARRGVGSSALKPTLWSLVFQMAAIGSTGWIWALLFLSSSPTISSTITSESLKQASIGDGSLLAAIVPALILGFIVPAVLMGLPSPTVVSNDFQQWAIVAWNMFPLLVFGFLKIFSSFTPQVTKQAPSGSKEDNNTVSKQNHLNVIRLVNAATLAVSFTMHAAVLSLSICTSLFPAIFNPVYIHDLDFRSLFIPPISISQGKTVGDGIRSFFLWDQVSGYAVMILIMMMQLRNASRASGYTFSWLKTIVACGLLSCIAGPGSTCLVASWLRDEILFQTAA